MARTESKWLLRDGGYIEPDNPLGYDILIKGTSKYLNFNSLVGSSGYGIRDNAGTMQFKNSGGSWTDLGGGGGGGGASTSLDNLASVAINTSLISDTDNTDDLGSSLIGWRTGYFSTSLQTPLVKADTSSGVIIQNDAGIDVLEIGASSGIRTTALGSMVVVDNFTVDTNTLFVDAINNEVGIGTLTPSSKLDILSLTEQLRTSYDVSNYMSVTVASDGGTIFDAVGTDPEFIFSDDVSVSGALTTSGNLIPFAIQGGNGSATTSVSGAQYVGSTSTTYHWRTGAPTTTITANNNWTSINALSQSITEGTSGTHALIANTAIGALDITDGTATTTNAATLYIEGAATGTATPTNNYALWVDDGDSKFDGNIFSNNTIEGFRTQATAAGTTTLVVTDAYTQEFTGTTTQNVNLPTTGVTAGYIMQIINNSTGVVTVRSSGANNIMLLAGGYAGLFTALVATPTTAAHWEATVSPIPAATTAILVGGGTTNSPVWTTATGSGSPVRATSPTFSTSVVGSATMAVFNTTSTTVNAFGAATTMTVGGTPTTAITHSYSANATATGTTKTVNLGTGGASGSTSNINIGSSNGGTTTISSPLISLGGTTGVTTTGSIELGAANDTTITRVSAGVVAIEGVTILTTSNTATISDKRITKRTGTVTSDSNPSINTDNVDFFSITAQFVDITSMTTNLTGTPTEGQTLWIAITGTAARAITWGSGYEASTVPLPTTTVSTDRLDVGFVWNTVTSKWRCIAVA